VENPYLEIKDVIVTYNAELLRTPYEFEQATKLL
jgi:hypothetical protein